MSERHNSLTQAESTLANHLREIRAILKDAKGDTRKRLKAREAECLADLEAERKKVENV